MDPVKQQHLDSLRAAHERDVHRTLVDNFDFNERLRVAAVRASYDWGWDMLEILLDRQQEAVSLEIGDGLYLRLDLDTNKIVGVELDNFRSRMTGESPELACVAAVMRVAGVERIEVAMPSVEGENLDPLSSVRRLTTV